MDMVLCFIQTGDTYIGEYKKSKKHGVGIYKWRDGVKEIGEFREWKIKWLLIRYNTRVF